jgi:hypothetical protein
VFTAYPGLWPICSIFLTNSPKINLHAAQFQKEHSKFYRTLSVIHEKELGYKPCQISKYFVKYTR